ncbi:MAG: hypothetical protein ABR543_12085 [Gemmatimonadaceae bacterium]
MIHRAEVIGSMLRQHCCTRATNSVPYALFYGWKGNARPAR